MLDNTSDWVKIHVNETPEEIRRKLDDYRDYVALQLKNEWKDITPEDWATDGKAEQRVEEILADLEARACRQ